MAGFAVGLSPKVKSCVRRGIGLNPTYEVAFNLQPLALPCSATALAPTATPRSGSGGCAWATIWCSSTRFRWPSSTAPSAARRRYQRRRRHHRSRRADVVFRVAAVLLPTSTSSSTASTSKEGAVQRNPEPEDEVVEVTKKKSEDVETKCEFCGTLYTILADEIA